MTRQMPFGFDPRFSLGHLIAAAPTIGLAIWLVSGYAHQGDENQKQLDRMRADMSAQITGLKSDVTAQVVGMRADVAAQMVQLQASNDRQFGMVRNDIANIPGMKERVDQLDRRVGNLETKVDPIQQAATQNTADIANMRESLRQRLK